LKEGFGAKKAVLFGERSWTYDEVADKTRRMIDVLAGAGVRRGERVLVILPDVPPFAWTFFGALGRGAVIAMGNPQAAPETLEYLVGYTRATAIVTVPAVAKLLQPIVEAPHSEVQVMLVAPDAATGSDPEARVTEIEFGGRIRELAPALAAATPAAELS
jgi:acyl-CoA synthetase (AMP-forming)/AMP-acid ligase II